MSYSSLITDHSFAE